MKSNAFLHVFGNMELNTGNPSVTGPTTLLAGETKAKILVDGNLVKNNGGGSKLFSLNNMLVCVQERTNIGSCTAFPGGSYTSYIDPAPQINDANCLLIVLPVELVSFQAKYLAEQRVVQLWWHTATEKNNSHFEVQRSVNGTTFSPVGRVAGHGTTAQPQYYRYTDINTLGQAAYYRLYQVDLDGQSAYSPALYVRTAAGPGKQPWLQATATAREFRVVLPQVGKARLEVLDALGRTAYSQPVSEAAATFTVPRLTEGVYVFRLLTDGGAYTDRLYLR